MALRSDPPRLDLAPLRGNLICMASMLLWAAGFPAAQALLSHWQVLPLIVARFLLAVALLIPAWLLLDGPRAVLHARWGRGTLVGGMGFGLGAWLLLAAQSLTDPVTVAIVASSMPVSAALLEMVLDGRRLTGGFVAGLGLATLGGLVAITGGAAEGEALWLGALAAVASCGLFVWGSRQTVRDFADLSEVGRTTITLAGGGLVLTAILLASLAAGHSHLPAQAPDAADWRNLLIYAVGSMALSQLLWLMGVSRLGVALASFHINTAPFYVMLILVTLGQGWSWQQAAGAGIVIAGVVVAQRRPRGARIA